MFDVIPLMTILPTYVWFSLTIVMQQYKAQCLTWIIKSNFVIAVQRNFQGVIWQHTVSVSGEEHLKKQKVF